VAHTAFKGFAGGWNGLIMRFRAADEYAVAASGSLARQHGSLSGEERYQQERTIFGFFASSMSAIECCCFSIYHLGKMSIPAAFAESARGIKVSTTATAVVRSYPTTQIAQRLTSLQADSKWTDLGEIRNTLLHRESPGITFHASTTAAPPPPPAEWSDRGVVLQPAMVNGPRTWLGSTVTDLVDATLDFVTSEL
jgi:hypothetical protein